ncbi:KCND3 [Cordylochernes scorpioides]|uniref:KCND3 n=1 Tax=Cordylochernes scorpioides TaxID=51811 RepID=A0ABY6LIU2_9ARAC|nr:KCND3 [Cordylochernes scorpioides]
MARIRIAKATSGAAFVVKKKAAEARLAAQESGQENGEDFGEDIFELQHHHLLRCLEKTTDREFVELEVPYNGHANRPTSCTPPRSPSAASSVSQEPTPFCRSCCRSCPPRRARKYQVGSLCLHLISDFNQSTIQLT